MISEIVIDSPVTGKRKSLTQAQFNSYMAQTNGAVLKWIVNPVAKHGEHDQKTHGNWATGSEVVTDLVAWRDSEIAKLGSDTDRELSFMDTILRHRVVGSMFTRAVDTYQSMLGYTINEALRDPVISTDGVATTIALLDGAIEYAPPLDSPITVYRGVKGNGLDFFEALKVGDVYSDKGFSSTSLDPAMGAKFANAESGMYQGIVLRMKLPAGTQGVFPASVTGIESQFSREAEFLLPRDSKFKILNNEGKVWDVELVND
jgi:hypothetical protein